MPDWNFKDNLSLQTNKFLNVSNYPVLGLNTSGNLDIFGPNGNDLYINSKTTSGTSHTYFHTNSIGNIISNTNLLLGVGTNQTTQHLLTLKGNSSIGLTDQTSYLKLIGGNNLTGGGIITLFGNSTGQSSGTIALQATETGGSVQIFTGTSGNKKFEILPNGISNFSPDGSTIVLNVSTEETILTNTVKLTNTTPSTSSTTGALLVEGGIGVKGDTFIDGGLFLNSVSGNINFSSSEVSTSYSNGSTYFFGGVGIICSTNAWSETAGGALSVAGGLALGKDAFIGGKINILSTEVSTNSFSGSGIFYGGIGINGQTNIRKNGGEHLALSPQVTGSETSILFYSSNSYSTTGSWKIGQNIYNSQGSLWISDLLEIRNNNKPHFPQGLYFGDNYNLTGTGGLFYLNNNSTTILTGNSDNSLVINLTTDSTSYTNGSLVVSGGLGVEKITVNRLLTNNGTIGGALLENNTLTNLLITGVNIINSTISNNLLSGNEFQNTILDSVTTTNSIITNSTVQLNLLTNNTITSTFISNATISNFIAFTGSIDDLYSTNVDIENLNSNYIYSNGIVITNGNIGIGTTSPSYSLDNKNISNLTNLIALNTTIGSLFISNGNIFINTTKSNSTVTTVGTKENFLINLDTLTSGNLLNASYNTTSGGKRGFIVHLTDDTKSSNVIFDTNDGFDFRTDSITRLHISPFNNRVGIYTTNPQATLDISGGARISDSLTVGNIVTSLFSVSSLISTNQTVNNLLAINSTINNLLINSTSNATSNTSAPIVVMGGLGVVQDVYVGGTIFTSSDAILKTNFKRLENTLEKIKSIQPVSFVLKSNPTRNYLGFKAGDFVKNFPEIVSKDQNAHMSISYDRVTAINTACIQELIYKIEQLENKLKNQS